MAWGHMRAITRQHPIWVPMTRAKDRATKRSSSRTNEFCSALCWFQAHATQGTLKARQQALTS